MLYNFWKQNNKEEIVVERTDKNFLRGVNRGEPIWKVSKGEEFMLIKQSEAMLWNQHISTPQPSQEPSQEPRKDPLSN